MWQGLLALKNDQAAVQLHFVSGNTILAQRSLPPPEGGPLLRIVQRMRLEVSQLDSVARRMTVSISSNPLKKKKNSPVDIIPSVLYFYSCKLNHGWCQDRTDCVDQSVHHAPSGLVFFTPFFLISPDNM